MTHVQLHVPFGVPINQCRCLYVDYVVPGDVRASGRMYMATWEHFRWKWKRVNRWSTSTL